MTRELEEEMNKLGASELITGCPECYYTIKQTAPKYRLRGLYEVIVENGLPKEYKGNGQTFSLHDPCKTRWEKEWHESARTLLTLMGYKIEEMKHSRELTYCCGQGGLSVGLNPFRVFNVATERLTEAHFDIVSYCAGCRETFSLSRPSVHILDLLFNPDWEKNKTKKADSVETRKKNQAALKSQLESRQKS
jgi:Fe-S oxidoreductase